ISGRLRLVERVGAGPQIVERVVAGAVGRRVLAHGPEIVRAAQSDGDVGDARFARIADAVLVRVFEHEAGQTCGRELAEVVVDAVGAGKQGEIREAVVGRGAAL